LTAPAATIGVVPTARTTPYAEAARELLRQTLFDAARDQLSQRPWSEVTMSDIAAAAGVSRQTLYKEFGNRNEFGLAFVIKVGESFLDDVDRAVIANVGDPRAAVEAALEMFLRTASEDPLIKLLLSEDGTGGMLPFVTTQGLPVVQWATARLATTIEAGWPQAPKADVLLLSEALVRLAISYITAPTESPETIATSVADLLGPFIDRALGGS
jgi:AcrR family transcriptional regulator